MLNAIGLTSAFATPPPPQPSPSTAPANGSDSFYSLFHQGTTESSADDAAADASARQPLHKKDDDPSKTAPTDANPQPVNPADNTPLPLKLSLNIHAPKAEAGNAETAKAGDKKAEGKLAGNDAALLVAQLPGLIQQPSVAPATQQAGAINANDASSQGDIRVDLDQKPTSTTSASDLAFALRMTPTNESAHTKAGDSQTGSAVNGVQLAQAEREAGGTDSNSANHHSASQQSDSNLASDAMPAAATLSTTSSYQVVHATAVDSTPAPAAPAPAADATGTSSQPSMIATHAPAGVHTDTTAKTGTASELSFSVSGSDQQKVEVRVMDRAGEVRVSVRTPNEELATTLRSDLGSLTGKLNQSGFTTEAFAPGSHSGEFSREQNNPSANQQQSSGQDRNFQRQGQQQESQQDSRSRRPQWLDELENSMSNTSVRKEGR